MSAYLTLEKAFGEAKKAISKDTEAQTIERFRRKRRSSTWSGPIIRAN